ncbi:fatty acid desaturase [Dongia mobilis]|uniref:Fatty acid desaturase n=1 Tax=Dongia mobilis TaxID=578943 RepID=A0A4R6WP12_9PROT|nr:fatty acid desaturase [Dongia mobilis]TDQ80831.1 fatty acid desaturase [Dongia mobilis]
MSAETIAATPARILNKGDAGRHEYIADLPTLFLGLAIYLGFFLLTWNYHTLPWWAVLALGAPLICLHGSLQHEAVHGYPFRAAALNRLFAGWSLWLWMPYDLYVRSHLKHHIDEDLTAPGIDPESNYLTQAQYDAMSTLHRLVRQAMRSMAGRLLLGPAYFTAGVFAGIPHAIRVGDRRELMAWAWHVPTTALILYWVVGLCQIPFWAYVALIAYPGTAMALLRSYAEHRAMPQEGHRTIILEAGAFWSVMFLWNNLHALHHREPGLAWWKRPQRYRDLKPALLEGNGHYFVPGGYLALARSYLLRPKEPIIHPGT